MGIFNKIVRSFNRIKELESSLDTRDKMIREDAHRESLEYYYLTTNLHRLRGSIAFRTRDVLDADIEEMRKRVRNINFDDLRSKG